MEKYLVPGYPEFQVPLRYIEYAVFSFEQNLVQSSRYFNDIENTQYKAPESSARMALLEPLDSEIPAVDIRQVWYRQVQVRICTVVWPAPPLYRIH